ncbi:MAG: hypothetical protein QOE69_3000 [Thermoleophilaceae bacterium]|jgi:hypothetical protein|nr:hypothetical protein [Thermoleophilaceae bacterium]
MSTHRTEVEGDAPGAGRPSAGRSALGSLALALTVISVIGFVVLAIGSIADWKGFSDDPDDTSTFADVVWITFSLGGLLALIVGVIAWIRGRARDLVDDIRAGKTAVGWVAVAIVLSFIFSALD